VEHFQLHPCQTNAHFIRFRGLSLEVIRKFAKQILRALTFLGRESINIIHCDIKPENVLLREPRRSDIKLIDFGSSCLASNMPYSYIQSRFLTEGIITPCNGHFHSTSSLFVTVSIHQVLPFPRSLVGTAVQS